MRWQPATRITAPVHIRWSSALAANPCCNWIKPSSTLCTLAASRLPSRLTVRVFRLVELIGSASAPRLASTVFCAGHELKLIFPQNGTEPKEFETWDFRHFVLQPMDGPQREHNTRLAVEFCLANPRWRLSLQTQKLLAIP